MEIQSLKVLITEQDLNSWVAQSLPKDQPVEDLQIRLVPEGLVVSGVYPLFVNVSFESHWELAVRDGLVTAKLSRAKALGLPVTVFRSVVTRALAEAVGHAKWLRIDDDTVVLDVDALLAENGVTARTNLTAVRCQSAALIVEAAG
jgi:hypothetical protein